MIDVVQVVHFNNLFVAGEKCLHVYVRAALDLVPLDVLRQDELHHLRTALVLFKLDVPKRPYHPLKLPFPIWAGRVERPHNRYQRVLIFKVRRNPIIGHDEVPDGALHLDDIGPAVDYLVVFGVFERFKEFLLTALVENSMLHRLKVDGERAFL